MRSVQLCLLLASLPARSQTLALTDCAVVDVRANVTRARQNIIIQGERIAAAGSIAAVRVPRGSRTVGCSGKFIIPGLWDMHVHVGEIEEDWFPLYLANGVTGLREMFASEANAKRQSRAEPPTMDRQEIAAGGQGRSPTQRHEAAKVGLVTNAGKIVGEGKL